MFLLGHWKRALVAQAWRNNYPTRVPIVIALSSAWQMVIETQCLTTAQHLSANGWAYGVHQETPVWEAHARHHTCVWWVVGSYKLFIFITELIKLCRMVSSDSANINNFQRRSLRESIRFCDRIPGTPYSWSCYLCWAILLWCVVCHRSLVTEA